MVWSRMMLIHLETVQHWSSAVLYVLRSPNDNVYFDDLYIDAVDVKPFMGGSYTSGPTSLLYSNYNRYTCGSTSLGASGGTAGNLDGYNKEAVPGYLRCVPSLASEFELNMALDSLKVKDKGGRYTGGGWRDDASLLRYRRPQDTPTQTPSLPSTYWYSPTSSAVSATADLDRLYDELEYSLYHVTPLTVTAPPYLNNYYPSRYHSNLSHY